MYSRGGTGPVAGRPLPDEDLLPSSVSLLRLPATRQLTIFQYCIPSQGRNHDRGLSKTVSDFAIVPTNSLLWGDPHASGSEIEQNGTFRIVSHNVNGLSKADDHRDVRNLATSMQSKAVALFGLQETNRNFERPSMLQSFHRLVKLASLQHKCAVLSAKLKWPTDYQPGGTAVSVRNQWATRMLEKGSDELGRWSWLTLAGRGTTKITFISGYRVCDGSNEAPVTARTVRAQQEWMYADRGKVTVNLRDQFITDVGRLITDFQISGHDIVLMFDANEASGLGSGVDRIMLSCGLVDAHSLTSDKSTPPATYQRGSAKIDFVLLSPRISTAVRAASILPLHDGYLSDHRALVVDFDAAALFAGPTSPVLPSTPRRLTSTNPSAVHLYIKEMRRLLLRHDLVTKVNNLQIISESGNWSEADVATWESIDSLLALSRCSAERLCKPIKSGTSPWSPELDRATKLVLYWSIRVREFSSGNTNRIMLDSLAATLDIQQSDQDWLPSATVRSNCRKARKALKRIKIDSSELRAQHLQAAAKLAATLHHMTEAAAVSAISSREKSSLQFQQLRSIFQRGHNSGFDRIDIPDEYAVLRKDEPVPRIPLVVKEQIEDVLLPHTEQRFRQHQETPFGHGARQASLGVDCSSEDANSIRAGVYDRELESLSEEAREWLRQLRTKDFVNGYNGVISTNISTEDWVTGWARMRECTASAPGSGHYGHYKTASVAARLPETHPDYLPVLAQIYALLWSMPLRHGFSPKRWRSCVDAIIEKIPGKPMIEKLRIIMLYEADFNFVLKLIWGKRLVANAEKYKCLGTSNHGSRAGRQTIDALMEKLLVYEISRLSRTSAVTVDNDAKSCYDRIIKTLSSIACMGVGLPLAAAVMHNKTHHGMEHRIKSSHGLFRSYYGTDSDPLEGSGQGSGASPAIWLIYLSSLLEAFRRFTTGISIPSPFEDIVVQLLAIFYVDDGMPGVNDALQREAAQLTTLLQQAEDCSQSWERLLFASGGALELTKCFTYILYWDLEGGKHRILDPSEIPGCTPEGDHFRGPLSLTYGDTSKRRHKIVTESPWTGRRTLGVRIAPAGNWNDEFTYRRSQSREIALLLAASSISKETARVGYRSMICPKLEYPLAVTQFTQRECDQISSPVLRVCLSKMGYNCNMPREVVYGPVELGGLGLHDYFIEQGIAQITTMVGHIRQESETARMIAIELQWCQAQAGTAYHLLESPHIPIDYIETCWVMSVRNFLSTFNLRLDFSDKTQQTLQCANDEFIMDALRSRGDCSATELQRLNACRMYLKLSRLSDITDAVGSRLRANALIGKDTVHFLSADRWPRQGRPPKPWWALWKRKLQLVFSRDGSSPQLRLNLGPWDSSSIKSHEWRTLVSTTLSQTLLFQLRDDGLYNVSKTTAASSRSGRISALPSSCVADAPSPCAIPADLGMRQKNGNHKIMFRRLQTSASPCTVEPTAPTSFSGFLSSQSAYIQRLLQHCDLSDTTALKMVDLAYTGRALDCGTDGGLLICQGTFGFAWGDPQSEIVVARGHGQVDGSNSCMSSTRTEMAAILGTLTYLRLVLEHYHVVLPKVGLRSTIYCDSQAALSRMKDLSYDGFGTTWRCRENYDIEAALRQCLSKLRIDIQWKWIRGHASKRKDRHLFSRAEVLNDEADELATSARSLPDERLDDHWPEQKISVVGPYGRLGGRLSHEIRYHCTAPDVMSYWGDRYHWSPTQVDLVDTISIKSATSKLRGDSVSRFQKLRCGWLPINSRESRCDPDRRSGCSSCSTVNLVDETVDHLFQCNSPFRRKAVLDRFATLSYDFRKWKTAFPIISAILAGSLAWIEGREIPSLSSLSLPDSAVGRMASQAYLEQSELGWSLLFRGFWSISWRLAQELQFRQYRSIDRSDTGARWAGKAQLWFFDLFELLWGMRNEAEHGADPDMQRLIRLAKCECAIRRLYHKGDELPFCERHPFREPIEVLLQRSVPDQELWISMTENFLPKAFHRLRKLRPDPRQSAMTDFFSRRS